MSLPEQLVLLALLLWLVSLALLLRLVSLALVLLPSVLLVSPRPSVSAPWRRLEDVRFPHQSTAEGRDMLTAITMRCEEMATQMAMQREESRVHQQMMNVMLMAMMRNAGGSNHQQQRMDIGGSNQQCCNPSDRV